MTESPEKNMSRKFWKEILKGIVTANPVFVLVLGLCATLAVTISIDNALGMGAGVLFVLLGSNIIIALIRKITPPLVRIPVFVVIIATFVTIISQVFEAYLPPLYESLGIYLPLIVVNCIILGRAEAFASKSTVLMSVADAIGMSLGFTISMLMVSIIREVLGTGKLVVFGKTVFSIPVLSQSPLAFFIMPPGAFLVLGLLLALFRWTGVLKNE